MKHAGTMVWLSLCQVSQLTGLGNQLLTISYFCCCLTLDWVADLQCIPAAAPPGGGPARLLLLRQALLACHAQDCSSTMQRLLSIATAESSGCSQQEQQWLQLLGSTLQLQATAGALAAVPAVEAHWMVLQSSMEQLQALGSGRSSSPSNLQAHAADASSTAAAYLSLASILQQAADHSSWKELCAVYAPVQCLDWRRVHAGASKLIQELSCCQGVPAATVELSGGQEQPQREATLACAAAAAALLPQHPAPWKAYADLLFHLASTSGQPAADATASGPQQPQQQLQEVTAVLGAAAEAYCQYLAASANTGALTSPQQGLGVLIKVLQIILQQGDRLHEQLSAAVSTCPAAVWQVLTNQLLAQLQHSSSAVRGLIQQLLQGLAVVVPCAVLYPLVVEVRAAQEAGQEVRNATSPTVCAELLLWLMHVQPAPHGRVVYTLPVLRSCLHVPCCDVLFVQVASEVSAVVSQLQRVQPRMMADTIAMAEALEGLTVTRWEAWAGLLVELSLETNRKLLSLRVGAKPMLQHWLVPLKADARATCLHSTTGCYRRLVCWGWGYTVHGESSQSAMADMCLLAVLCRLMFPAKTSSTCLLKRSWPC